MAKKIEITATPDTPYIDTDAQTPSKQNWLKTKRGKLVSTIVGGLVILGGTFTAGVAVGEHSQGDGFSRFGGFGDDHGFGRPDRQFNPNGQNDQFQGPNGHFNPNQQGPQPGNGSGTGTNGSTGTNG